MNRSQSKRRTRVSPATPPPPRPAPAQDICDAQPADFIGLALWMAASLAGLVTAALVSQAPTFRNLARRFGWLGPARPTKSRRPARPPLPPRPTGEQALPMLADAIVGNTKSAIARVFGAPPSAALSPRTALPPPGAPSAASFWMADTWYYPLPRNGRLAMAIQFADDLAREVEFLRVPGL